MGFWEWDEGILEDLYTWVVFKKWGVDGTD